MEFNLKMKGQELFSNTSREMREKWKCNIVVDYVEWLNKTTAASGYKMKEAIGN